MRIVPLLILMLPMGCTSINIPVEDNNERMPLFGPKGDSVLKYRLRTSDTHHFSNIVNNNFKSTDSLSYDFVELRQINESSLELRLSNGKEEVNTVLEGNYDRGMFKIKNKYQVAGIPPLSWVLRSRSGTFVRNSNNDLTLYYKHGGTILLTLLPAFGTSTGQLKYIFEQVD